MERQVRFDLPMDTDEDFSYHTETQSPMCMATAERKEIYLGIGPPPGLARPLQPFNFGFDIPSRPSKFNFGMDLPIPPAYTPTLTSERPFNFGTDLTIQATESPKATAAEDSSSTGKPFNFGFDLPVDAQPLPTIPPLPAFNFGFDLPVVADPQPAIPPSPFNFGMNLDISVGQHEPETPTPHHVGYTTTNKKFLFVADSPAPAGQWKPIPIQAREIQLSLMGPPHPVPPIPAIMGIPTTHASPMPAVAPIPTSAPTSSSPIPAAAPIPTSAPTHSTLGIPDESKDSGLHATSYKPITLPNLAGIMPQSEDTTPDVPNRSSPPTLASLIGDSQQAAIQILECLRGTDVDKVAQTMLGGVLAADEDLRKPQPDEVLGSNRAMMSVFCDTRDRLTKAFKEL
ncbi:uncharacterized protein F5147DRAFT_775703 [Suillus discolor]|uniref:Uncharacterized protein n=1 Tax=Suillus discolor TaxID=1912936 RepID=A0A9P7JS29_9AGAM|nr:uncharacterized protein F5147DRAFT_775703 [Suillus discolor]KAG2103992.1 hypothetical protein F5147DRAFT_775703 [Suillus discolor]